MKSQETEDTMDRDAEGVGQGDGAALWSRPLDSGLQAWKAWAEEPVASAASEGIEEQAKGG